uniref:Uncharacterized protein n=1 Tax=Anopheles christyi TaxID=43041 RepID=A0A182KHV9_9DIPT
MLSLEVVVLAAQLCQLLLETLVRVEHAQFFLFARLHRVLQRAVLMIEQFLLVKQPRMVTGTLAKLFLQPATLFIFLLGAFLRFTQRGVKLFQLFSRPTAAFLEQTVLLRQLGVLTLHLLQLGLVIFHLRLQLTERVLFQLNPCLAVLSLQPLNLLLERLFLLLQPGMCLLDVLQLLL